MAEEILQAERKPTSDTNEIVDDGDSDSDKEMIEEVRSKELRAAPSSLSIAKREAEASSSSNAKREAEVSEPSNLEQHWKKIRTTGKGVEMISKIGHLLDEESQKHSDRVGFLQVRLVVPKATNRKPKVQRKEDGDKNFLFSDCNNEIQRGLRKPKVAEWQTWKKFNARVSISKEEAAELRDQGVAIQPTQ